MAYFPNGTSGQIFREQYCDRCKWDKERRCPIWNAHLMFSYDECNNDKSILHMLITETKDKLYADECYFFEHDYPDMFKSQRAEGEG